MVLMEAGRAGWWPVAIKSGVDKGLNSTQTYKHTNIDRYNGKKVGRPQFSQARAGISCKAAAHKLVLG